MALTLSFTTAGRCPSRFGTASATLSTLLLLLASQATAANTAQYSNQREREATKRYHRAGLIAGITVGVAVFLLLVGGVGFCLYRNRKADKALAARPFIQKDECPNCGHLSGQMAPQGWRWIHIQGCSHSCETCGGLMEMKAIHHANWCSNGPVKNIYEGEK